MAKTPDFITIEAWSYSKGVGQEPVQFPPGTFMRPVDTYYLPKVILDSSDYMWFNPTKEVYCYSPIGLIPVPKSLLRRV